MCGISGIINKNSKLCELTMLHKANDCIKHRGPDGDGFYNYKNLGLAHRRLAIIDLTAAGSQPMELNDRYVITYNGEIYNYLEIKAELVSLGIIFSTLTDTEVILKSFEYWGEDCVSHFNGMWAFAIFDKQLETIFISRDRFGVKPLYYVNNSDYFAFGSEIKQFLEIGVEARLNKQALADYMFLGYSNHTSETFFDGIMQLEPGHNLKISIVDIEPSIKKYYELAVNEDINRLNESDAINKYIDYLNDSIKLRLRSDVVVGSCLSGGLDSSYISAYAGSLYNEQRKSKLKAVTAKSIQEDNDESKYAKLVADHSNLDWFVSAPDKEDFNDVLDKVIEIQEEPFGGPSVIMQYYVLKMAKEQSCIVMLDGQGGDETLLGYERYYTSFFNSLGLLEKIKMLFLSSNNSKLTLTKMFKYLIYFNSYFLRRKYLCSRNRFLKNNIKSLFNSNLLRSILRKNKNIYDLQIFDLQSNQLRTLLMYEDKNSMAHSIETRLPFLDYRVVEIAVSMNCNVKIKNGWTKYPLRLSGSLNGVIPKSIAWRKNKIGFEAPTKIWLTNKDANLKLFSDSPFLNSFIDFEKIKSLDDKTYWKILNLYKWQKIFNVNYD